ncbi:hypothetical protein GCK72_025070 [Caenorhabditis remanei]|uniref:Uncharacterized protein n=1 Tax=Caenorhabditis remanei TaxID=31234 RepID=A0A6A5G1D2_CAERE|nr:hypothetical protein GCK72_025070 [Caenorhabditis remanei]KAF1748603.1 hypothetical protein GCK72_025070 [Caenorhabditis remanei]
MMNAVLDLHPEAQLDATIDAQIVTVIALLNTSIRKYMWTGGWDFLDEWYPYMMAISDNIRECLQQIYCSDSNFGRRMTYEESLAMLSVLREMENCILAKNKKLDSQILMREQNKNRSFEPLESECYRKIGEIVTLTVSNRLIYYSLYFDGSGAVNCDGLLLQFKQIRDLMPTISDEHAKLLLQVEKMRALPGGEILEHIPMVNTNTTDNGNRMITELTTMTKYLVQHRFSRNWRKAIIDKIAEIQPIVDEGRNTMETREAFQWLHQKYYRIREEYEQAKNRAERSPNLDRQK